jgi:hypothetical protein
MEFQIRIADSQIDVTCTLNRWSPEVLASVYMRALDFCRASVNLVAFAMGCGLSVHLETLIDPVGASSTLFFNDPKLPHSALHMD